MKLEKAHIVTGIIALAMGILGSAGGYLISYGQELEKVRTLENKVAALSSSIDELARPEIRKGNFCLKLYDAMYRAYDRSASTSQIDDIQERIERLGCDIIPMSADKSDESIRPSDTSISGKGP